MGMSQCTYNFVGTTIGYALTRDNITITCTSSEYVMVVIFSLIQSIQYFILYSAWLLCTEKYKYSRKAVAASAYKPTAAAAPAAPPSMFPAPASKW